MNDLDVIDQLKSAVGPVPDAPPHRMDAIRGRARLARQRRWSEAIGSAAMVVAIVGGIVAVGGRPSGVSQRPVDLLSTTEAKAVEAGTARISTSVTMTGFTEPVTTEAEVDFRNETLRMTTGPTAEQRVVGSDLYVRIDQRTRDQAKGKLDGKSWLHRRVSGTAGGIFTGEFARPQDMFKSLRDFTGEPVETGRREIRGVATTGYTFDVGKAFPVAGTDDATMTVSLFVDDDGLPRRMVMDFRMEGGQSVPGGVVETNLTMDFYDYGARIAPVTAPPAAEVVEEAAFFEALGLGESYRKCGEQADEVLRNACRIGIATTSGVH